MPWSEVTPQGLTGQGGQQIIPRMPSYYAIALLFAGWLVWALPFVLAKRNSATPEKVDRRARWGIIIVAIGYGMLWFGNYWVRHPPRPWRVIVSVVFMILGSLLSWGARRALGKQWRVEAGLNPDHELVTSGPYRLVRIRSTRRCCACFWGRDS